ncbi:MAG: hypothetical protein KDC98_12185, partial [Planctomycetes bacterium]|nr:hypothetical protein [Planctomycetota bacterium]
TPRIGKAHEVTVFDLPMNLAIMVVGYARTLPLSLAPYGAPGCRFHISPDAAWFLAGAAHQAHFAFPIPDNPAFVGSRFLNQAVILDASAGNALGAVVSEASEGVVGHW